MKSRSGGDLLAKAVLLKQINQVKNIFRHRQGTGRVESNDQFDRDVMPVKLVGDVEGCVAPNEWPISTMIGW